MMRPVIVSTLIELTGGLVSGNKIRTDGHPRKVELGLPISTGAKHVDSDDDDDTHHYPDCIIDTRVPVIYQEGSSG